MVPKGHEVAKEQFQLTHYQPLPLAFSKAERIAVNREGGKTTLTGSGFAITFDEENGLLTQYVLEGKTMLDQPLAPNFWRAPTDNDFGNGHHKRTAAWKKASKEYKLQSMEVVNGKDKTIKKRAKATDKVMIKTVHELSSVGGTLAITYTINGKGEILVDNTLSGIDKNAAEIPRIGFTMVLPTSYDNIEYYGRGDFENYWDRNTAAFVSLNTAKVEDLYVPYIRPQENGYRTDNRWISFKNSSGTGLLLETIPKRDLLGFSAHYNTIGDFDAVDDKTGHTHDIKKRDNIYVNFDYKQMGVGGNDSWGARTQPEYTLTAKEYQHSFYLKPLQ